MFRPLMKKIEVERKSSPAGLSGTMAPQCPDAKAESQAEQLACSDLPAEDASGEDAGFIKRLDFGSLRRFTSPAMGSFFRSPFRDSPDGSSPQTNTTLQTPQDIPDVPSPVGTFEEENELDENELDGLDQEQLLKRHLMLQKRFRDRHKLYKELLTLSQEQRREKEKLQDLLSQNQDKALRRVSELKEEMELEKQAKHHLREEFDAALDEKMKHIETLRTQVLLLKSEVKLQQDRTDHEPIDKAYEAADHEERHGQNEEINNDAEKHLEMEDVDSSKEKEALHKQVQRQKLLLHRCHEEFKQHKEREVTLEADKQALVEQLKTLQIDMRASAAEHQAEKSRLVKHLREAKNTIDTLEEDKESDQSKMSHAAEHTGQLKEELQHRIQSSEHKIEKLEQELLQLRAGSDELQQLKNRAVRAGFQELEEAMLKAEQAEEEMKKKLEATRVEMEEEMARRVEEMRANMNDKMRNKVEEVQRVKEKEMEMMSEQTQREINENVCKQMEEMKMRMEEDFHKKTEELSKQLLSSKEEVYSLNLQRKELENVDSELSEAITAKEELENHLKNLENASKEQQTQLEEQLNVQKKELETKSLDFKNLNDMYLEMQVKLTESNSSLAMKEIMIADLQVKETELKTNLDVSIQRAESLEEEFQKLKKFQERNQKMPEAFEDQLDKLDSPLLYVQKEKDNVVKSVRDEQTTLSTVHLNLEDEIEVIKSEKAQFETLVQDYQQQIKQLNEDHEQEMMKVGNNIRQECDRRIEELVSSHAQEQEGLQHTITELQLENKGFQVSADVISSAHDVYLQDNQTRISQLESDLQQMQERLLSAQNDGQSSKIKFETEVEHLHFNLNAKETELCLLLQQHQNQVTEVENKLSAAQVEHKIQLEKYDVNEKNLNQKIEDINEHFKNILSEKESEFNKELRQKQNDLEKKETEFAEKIADMLKCDSKRLNEEVEKMKADHEKQLAHLKEQHVQEQQTSDDGARQQLEEQCEKHEHQISNHKQIVEELEIMLKHYKMEKEQKEKEIESSGERFQENENLVKDLQQKLAVLTNELQELEKQCEMQNKGKEEFQKKSKELNQQLQDQNSKLKSRLEKHDLQFKLSCSLLETNTSSLLEHLGKTLEDRIITLNERMEGCKNMVEKFQVILLSKENMVNALNAQIVSQNEQMDKQKQELAEICQSLQNNEQAVQEFKTVEVHCSHLESELELLKKHLSDKENEVTHLQEDMNKQMTSSSELCKQLQDKDMNIVGLQKEIYELQEKLTKDHEMLLSNMEDMHRKEQEMQDCVLQLKAEISILEDQKLQAVEQVERYKENIETQKLVTVQPETYLEEKETCVATSEQQEPNYLKVLQSYSVEMHGSSLEAHAQMLTGQEYMEKAVEKFKTEYEQQLADVRAELVKRNNRVVELEKMIKGMEIEKGLESSQQPLTKTMAENEIACEANLKMEVIEEKVIGTQSKNTNSQNHVELKRKVVQLKSELDEKNKKMAELQGVLAQMQSGDLAPIREKECVGEENLESLRSRIRQRGQNNTELEDVRTSMARELDVARAETEMISMIAEEPKAKLVDVSTMIDYDIHRKDVEKNNTCKNDEEKMQKEEEVKPNESAGTENIDEIVKLRLEVGRLQRLLEELREGRKQELESTRIEAQDTSKQRFLQQTLPQARREHLSSSLGFERTSNEIVAVEEEAPFEIQMANGDAGEDLGAWEVEPLPMELQDAVSLMQEPELANGLGGKEEIGLTIDMRPFEKDMQSKSQRSVEDLQSLLAERTSLLAETRLNEQELREQVHSLEDQLKSYVRITGVTVYDKGMVAAAAAAATGVGEDPKEPEPTEVAYLRKVLFEYMMGRETKTLAKVITTVLRFPDDLAQKVLEREEVKSTRWGR
uniref:GRIP domain-containing protein n=1 Tax=Eptatretus burgeri TaxID=7764 RepID=A0A8C4QYD9_EPTBU